MVGRTVHAVCPNRKAGRKVRTAIRDFAADAAFAEVEAKDFDARRTRRTRRAT